MTLFSFLLLPTPFLAPDNGGAGGSSPSGPSSIEDQLAAARSESQTLREQVTSLTQERDLARSERDSLQTQFNSATAAGATAVSERDTARRELSEARTQIVALTGQRDAAQQNVTRLESLCGLKGIDPNSAVPAPASSEEPQSWKSFDERIRSAASPEERARIAKEYESAVAAGKVA